MNATRKKRKSPRYLPPATPAPPMFFHPFFATRAPRAVKLAHLHSARSDKDGKWPAFACLFHFFNSALFLSYPPQWWSTRNHTHGGKIYGKTPSLSSLNRVCGGCKNRGDCILSISPTATGSSYLANFWPRAFKVFIRCRVMRDRTVSTFQLKSMTRFVQKITWQIRKLFFPSFTSHRHQRFLPECC